MEDRGMTPEEIAQDGWRFVINPMTGKPHPDFDEKKVYQFRLRWEDEIRSYRMADKHPLMNVWGLFWRELPDEKGESDDQQE